MKYQTSNIKHQNKLYKIGLCMILLVFLFNNAHAQTWWGSIYMDVNTGIAGGVSNSRTNAIANGIAEESCVEKHDKKGLPNKCEYVGSFKNSCGAVYWSPKNKKYAWAWDGVNANRAESRAYKECVRVGGKECQLRLSFCNTRIL